KVGVRSSLGTGSGRRTSTLSYGTASSTSWAAASTSTGGQPRCATGNTRDGARTRRTNARVIEGAAFDVDAVIALGRTLRPQYDNTRVQTKQGRKRAFAEELERIKLMGAVRPLNEYNEWMSSAAACKRAFPDDMDVAFELFDTLSACSPPEIYKDADAAR